MNYTDQSLTVLCLYRPPPSKKNQLKTTQFTTEFSELLEDLATRCLKLVVIGDINLHFDSNSDPNVKSLKSLFPTLHLVQHISVPTHRRGHTLDWLIASEDISIQDIEVVDKLLSDHFIMSFVTLSHETQDKSIYTILKIYIYIQIEQRMHLNIIIKICL